MYKLGSNSTNNLKTILKAENPKSHILIKAITEFIKISPIDFGIISNGAYRTAEEQQELYEKGVSKCDGYLLLSNHQKGLAVDIVPWVNKKYTWETKHCFYLAGAFKAFCNINEYKIISGADWNNDGNLVDGWDPCHMEIEE